MGVAWWGWSSERPKRGWNVGENELQKEFGEPMGNSDG